MSYPATLTGSGWVIGDVDNPPALWSDASGTGLVPPDGIGVASPVKNSGVSAPASNLTAAAGSAGALTGNYYWGVAFILADGTVTAPWPGTPTLVSLTAQRANLTNIPVSLSPLVVGRRLYRTVAGPVDVKDLRFLADINDNTTTTFSDNTPDGSLGAAADWMSTANGTASANGVPFVRGLGSDVIGSQALAIGVGSAAGYASLSVGFEAGKATTTGRRNVAVGQYALTAITTGSTNTALGVHALNTQTTGSNSTALGYGALFFHNGAGINTAVGSEALYNVTGATGQNTAVGYRAGLNATTGNQNTLVGHSVAQNGAGGQGNVGIGWQAFGLGTLTGNFNVCAGSQAAENLSSGSLNTCVGYRAGLALSTQSSNVFIGAFAGRYTQTSNNFFLNNQDRANDAGEQSLSLMWGTFAATAEAQRLRINAPVRHLTTTVASLPAASIGAGFRAFVTDANATTFASVVAGGGANGVPVYSDGTNWRIG